MVMISNGEHWSGGVSDDGAGNSMGMTVREGFMITALNEADDGVPVNNGW